MRKCLHPSNDLIITNDLHAIVVHPMASSEKLIQVLIESFYASEKKNRKIFSHALYKN
jgi:hypothetical protein